MKSHPKPLSISPELAAHCDGPDQDERMDVAFRTVLTVSTASIPKDEKDNLLRKKGRTAKKGKNLLWQAARVGSTHWQRSGR